MVDNKSFLQGGGERGGPDYIVEKCSRVSGVHGYSRRNRQHAFVIPKAKTKVYEACFHVLATNLWNSFPTSIYLGISGEYISVNAFKCRLRELLAARC